MELVLQYRIDNKGAQLEQEFWHREDRYYPKALQIHLSPLSLFGVDICLQRNKYIKQILGTLLYIPCITKVSNLLQNWNRNILQHILTPPKFGAYGNCILLHTILTSPLSRRPNRWSSQCVGNYKMMVWLSTLAGI